MLATIVSSPYPLCLGCDCAFVWLLLLRFTWKLLSKNGMLSIAFVCWSKILVCVSSEKWIPGMWRTLIVATVAKTPLYNFLLRRKNVVSCWSVGRTLSRAMTTRTRSCVHFFVCTMSSASSSSSSSTTCYFWHSTAIMSFGWYNWSDVKLSALFSLCLSVRECAPHNNNRSRGRRWGKASTWQSVKPKNAENGRKFTSFISIMVALTRCLFFSLLLPSTSFPVSSCIVLFVVRCIWCFVFWQRTVFQTENREFARQKKFALLLFHLLLISPRFTQMQWPNAKYFFVFLLGIRC